MPDEAPEAPRHPDYYRRDQSGGVTAPDLSKDCSLASHIVRARGKRTKYTSVSLDAKKIDEFGPALYKTLYLEVVDAGHTIIEHGMLIKHLREAASATEKGERLTAIQAQRYATRRLEGLINWNFDISRVERKELITWAFNQIQKLFRAA